MIDFEPYERKVHFYMDQSAHRQPSHIPGVLGKPYADTLCKGNFSGPELLTTTDPLEVTCKTCLKDRRMQIALETARPAGPCAGNYPSREGARVLGSTGERREGAPAERGQRLPRLRGRHDPRVHAAVPGGAEVSWQIPGSSITCSLGVGCQETGICYAEAHGQPEQCGVTIVDGIDLSAIKPLTEKEAEDYFSRPTMFDRYQSALAKLSEEDRLAVTLYVENLKGQINAAYGQGRHEAHLRPGFGEMGG